MRVLAALGAGIPLFEVLAGSLESETQTTVLWITGGVFLAAWLISQVRRTVARGRNSRVVDTRSPSRGSSRSTS